MDSPIVNDDMVIGELSRRRIAEEEAAAAAERAAKKSRKSTPSEPDAPADEKEVTP